MRNAFLITLIALVSLTCNGGSESASDALLAGMLLNSQSGPASISGNAAVPLPPIEPAPPGEPLNEPILLAPQVNTNDHMANSAIFGIANIAFQKPVHSKTSLMAFIGPRSMTLLPNNTVVNSFQHLQGASGGFFNPIFPGVSADKKLKVLLIARNEFGMSTLSILVGHARLCRTALVLPATVGNCGDFCIQAAALNPTTLRLTTTRTTVAGNTFAQISIFVSDVHGLTNLAQSISEYADPNNGAPIPAGPYDTSVDLIHDNVEAMCIRIDSSASIEPPFEFNQSHAFVRLP